MREVSSPRRTNSAQIGQVKAVDRTDRMYRAEITKVRSEGLYVIIPKLGKIEYGPLQRLVNGKVPDPYVQYAQVLVSTLGGVPDEMVVLGVLTP